MGKSCRFPAERLSWIETFVSCPSRNDTVLFNDGNQLGDVTFTRVFDPTIIRVGNDNNLTMVKDDRRKNSR